MKYLFWKLLLIVIVLGLCGLGLAKGLRLGKDLKGGVSLIYQVNLPEDIEDPEGTLNQVITVLKERVNPTGVFDISMQVLGRDRIEVVMPLPNDEVRTIKKELDASIKSLLSDLQIDPVQLDQAVARGEAVEVLAKGQPEGSARHALAVSLQEAWNESQTDRAALSEARERGVTDELRLAELEQAVADVESRYDALRRAVLIQSLDEERLSRALAMSNKREQLEDEAGRPLRDEKTNQPVLGPSARAEALSELRDLFPDYAERIDAVVEKYDLYQSKRTSLDDPEDLKRLLRGAGVLEFHIAVTMSDAEGLNIEDLREQLREHGPASTDSPIARWFPINSLEQWYKDDNQRLMLEAAPEEYFAGRGLVGAERDGVYYLLLYTTDAKSMTHAGEDEWSIQQAFKDVDRLGRQAVSFRLDSRGGILMSRMTGANVGKPMAIVLDDQVYTAPNLNSRIDASGVIEGEFTNADINYLIRVLAAGSLSARLSPDPIAEITLGPSLGRDNLLRGRDAFIIALIAVAVFMLVYYLLAGIVAVIALAANGLMLFGIMCAIDGTFTLPGLAGIVLTIGMAVDANVLIYERIREEMFGGEGDLRTCIRVGYAKALSTIIDGNVTNLIVAIVLGQTATTEVKGFALTLAIGILSTLFTGLFLTRQIFYVYTDVLKMRKLPMLPTVIPAIHRALEPSINWYRLRYGFWIFSAATVMISLVLIFSRGADLFDTELRGGVSATLELAPGQALTRAEVEQEIRSIAGSDLRIDLPNVDPALVRSVREEFARAAVLSVDNQENANLQYQVKIASPAGIAQERDPSGIVVELIVEQMGDRLNVQPRLTFEGAAESNPSSYLSSIDSENLGQVIGDPSVNVRVPQYVGGVAILLRNVDPAVSAEELDARIEQMRGTPTFRHSAGRSARVFPLGAAAPDEPASNFVVVVRDDAFSGRTIDVDLRYEQFEKPEWDLVHAALTEPARLSQVSSYSSAVAESLKANAIVAVVLSLLAMLIYIWVRFGSLIYSAASVLALMHDVIVAMGLLAATAFIGGTAAGEFLLIDEFRIDLGVVAALLTVVGYSVNDTIVILDRVRENRGKRNYVTPEMVNTSLNQTFSRTVFTSGTTILAVLIMYFEGGTGIRSFTFTLLAGLFVGTYSSIGIAAPMVVNRKSSGRGSEWERVIAPHAGEPLPPREEV